MFDWKPKLFRVWWVIRGHQIALTPDGVFDGGRLAVCETHFSFCPWSHLNCLQQKKWIYNNMLFYLWILNVFSFLTVLFLLFCFLTQISLLKEKNTFYWFWNLLWKLTNILFFLLLHIQCLSLSFPLKCKLWKLKKKVTVLQYCRTRWRITMGQKVENSQHELTLFLFPSLKTGRTFLIRHFPSCGSRTFRGY